MKLKIYKTSGKASTRTCEVADAVFDAEPNEHAVYMSVKKEQTNSRQGNAATKTRAMVSGGGKKPWKQKGRGTARAGTTRSPIWKGGGSTHGPQPHDYHFKLPKKVNKLARISVLSTKTRVEELKVLEDFQLAQVKTKEMYQLVKNFGLENESTLVLLPEYSSDMLLASRNIKNFKIQIASDVSTEELLRFKNLLVTESAIKKLEGVLQS